VVEIPPPGRERDALIAERVMGWIPRPLYAKCDGEPCFEVPSGALHYASPWSTDDALSMAVLKPFWAWGCSWNVWSDHPTKHGCCIFGDPGNDDIGPELANVTAETIAAAVTEAALLAVGGM
jgi:hypothetical protein